MKTVSTSEGILQQFNRTSQSALGLYNMSTILIMIIMSLVEVIGSEFFES